MRGPGVTASSRIQRTNTVWFEGPLVPLPASQEKEDYPKDYTGEATLASDTPVGVRYWRVWNSQGATPSMKFVVGDLPEVVEEEIDGTPIPTRVQLPVTINGRVFPREDVDIWSFAARAGEVITCEVTAARLGSSLDARVEIRGPLGHRLAEGMAADGADPLVRFNVPSDGLYEARIHDVKFGGLQSHVYRLTITAGPYVDAAFPLGGKRGSVLGLELFGANLPTNALAVRIPDEKLASFLYRAEFGGPTPTTIVLDLDDLPEVIEPPGRDTASTPQHVTLPAVLNGRIARPGEADVWSFDAKVGQKWEFDLRAARLGSPLDSVLTLLEAGGKPLATCDDRSDGQTDSLIHWVAPADGAYSLRVEDRFASRGGPLYSYRLRAAAFDQKSDFSLSIPSDALSVERGGEVKFKVAAMRVGNCQGPITLTLDGLPPGVSVSNATIAEKANDTEILLRAEKTTRIQTARVVLNGKSSVDGKELIRRASVRVSPADPPLDKIFLAVAMPTPFKFTAVYEQQFAPRGSVFVRHYRLDRGGFTGPLSIELADRQVRHTQGVKGPTIVLPPDATEFDYPLTLSPFMEIGRTSRTNVMVVGEVVDSDDSRHQVAYTTPEQNEQIVVITAPGRLSVIPRVTSVRAAPGREARVPLEVSRDGVLNGDVTVELTVPAHLRGVTASPLLVPANQNGGDLKLHFSGEIPGSFNMPVTLRATTRDERGYPLVAECGLVIVPP